jgi:hypothetical protein
MDPHQSSCIAMPEDHNRREERQKLEAGLNLADFDDRLARVALPIATTTWNRRSK